MTNKESIAELREKNIKYAIDCVAANFRVNYEMIINPDLSSLDGRVFFARCALTYMLIKVLDMQDYKAAKILKRPIGIVRFNLKATIRMTHVNPTFTNLLNLAIHDYIQRIN